MTTKSDLSKTFLHLDDEGGASPIALTRAFWSGQDSGRYARVMGAFDFEGPGDLHSAMQEVHPEADEVIYLASGAIDLLIEREGREERVALEAGQMAIVPRGVWHRLEMRAPGRLVFVNSRAGMRSRRWNGSRSNESRSTRGKRPSGCEPGRGRSVR